MLNRDYLGYQYEPTSVLVEVGQLKLFNKALGETRAVYLDETAARAAGYRSILAPPTFSYVLINLAPPSGPGFEELGLDFKYLLHGEDGFVYQGQIYAGDVITMQTTITDIYDKKDGALEFMVQETAVSNQLGEQVQTRRSVFVMRRPQEARK